jgi:putative sigma-54 modulation protein
VKVALVDRTAGLVRPELRQYTERKLSRLERHFERVADADVDFSQEAKHGGLVIVTCRINVHINGRRTPVLSAKERGIDAQTALDLALDKIDRQVVKLKEMRRHHKQAVSPLRVPDDAQERAPKRSAEPERIRMKLRPMSVGDAIAELQSDGEAFHVFLDEDSGAIEIAFRRADGSVAVLEPIVP